MRDRLKGLVDPHLRQPVVHGSRLAEGVSRIPDDVLDPSLIPGLQEFIDDGSPPVRPRRNEREGGHHPGNLPPERGPLDPVGPPDVPGLHGKVQLEAGVRPSRPAVGGRAVPGSGVWINGVLLAPAPMPSTFSLSDITDLSPFRRLAWIHVPRILLKPRSVTPHGSPGGGLVRASVQQRPHRCLGHASSSVPSLLLSRPGGRFD
jgi:hypothetical protein